MDPPPAPPLTTTTTTTTTTTAYPDSLDSSPRSRNTDSWGDDPPPPPPSQTTSKLRLMCSYGGHIVPRPHDKSLCYVGGDTRMVVVDRHSSLTSLSSKLSHTLLNSRPFTLKYQLPNEDLDSLISVTTDEDLDNMIDEYDRTNSSNNTTHHHNKPCRLRLFLFPLKPDTSQSIGPILENSAKSEDWFLNALNGAGLLSRGFSDSASVNCLLGLDDDVTANNNNNNDNNNNNLDMGAKDTVEVGSQKNVNVKLQGQDVQSVPDSPMLETSSSFGSTSSSPSLANLPPIRVREDQKVMGVEEQFGQMSVGQMQKQQQQQQDEGGGFVVLSSLVNIGVPLNSGVVAGDYTNRVYSDDERSDHGVPVGYRKPPPPQSQPTLTQQRSSGGGGGGNIDLASPDSVSSDSSLSNPLSRQKPVIYQDPSVVQVTSGINRGISNNPVDSKVNISDPNARVQIQQQMQDSGYVLQHQPQSQPQFDQQQQQQLQQQQQQQLQQQQQQQQLQQQQYIHAGAQYIYHHPSGPNSAYYPVYPPQQQQQQQQQQHHYHQLDQQQQVYYVQARQPQAYNLPVQQQSSVSETAPTIPSNRPQTPPNPAMVHNPAAAYNPMRNAPKPEMAAPGVYRTANTGSPQLVQVPTSQHQQQFVGYSQIHHPSQSVAPNSAATANYGYEFADPSHAQIYYTQPLAPTMPSQYQTMTAAAVFPESSAQSDSIMQHIRTSQPL